MKLRIAGACSATAAVIAGMALGVAPANAATITIDPTLSQYTASDPGLVNDGKCSLREAIEEANADSTSFSECVFSGTLGADTITLTADTYTIGLGALNATDADALTLVRTTPGLTMIDANGSSRVINHSSGPLTLNRVGVQEGETSSDGAGINNSGGSLTLTDSRVAFNDTTGPGGLGGGGVSMGAGTLNVTRTTFDQNRALSSSGTAAGGAIQIQFGAGGFITDSEFSANVAAGTATNGTGIATGGAIFGSATNSATSGLEISGSSFIDNQASHSVGGQASFGGGIYWLDDTTPVAELRINNSTFSGNGAIGASATNTGGAIYAQGGATKLAQVTFGANTTTPAAGQGDAISYSGGGSSSFQVRGSIFDDSSTDECATVSGSLTSVGYNVDQGTTCGLAIAGQDKQNQDAATLPPAQNGGPTRTRALGAGSPAVDANGGCASTNGGFVTNDQRGFPRGSTSPEDGTSCDSGAYERLACKGQNVTIFGTDGANASLNGTTGNDVIAGLSGDDFILGNDGADTVCGGDGDDSVGGGAGADNMDGGAGPDTVSYVSAGTGVQVDLAAGTATGDGADTLSGFSNVFGSLLPDTIAGDGNPNVLEGYFDGDTLEGRGGADTLNGTTGIFSGGGDRVVYDEAPSAVTVDLAGAAPQATGGDGPDTLIQIEGATGSLFDDEFKGNGDGNIFDGLGGNDRINYGSLANATSPVTVDLVAGTATGTSTGSDFLTSIENVTGSLFGDTITGNAAANTISGLNGDDAITGGAGSDTIFGGADIDTIFARDSVADTVSCGTEADTVQTDLVGVDTVNADCETTVFTTAAPALTSTDPASGSNQNSLRIKGTATPGTAIAIYANGSCTGAPAASGSQADLAGAGIAVSVPDNSTTTFSATATGPGGTSACSSPLTYSEVTSTAKAPTPPTPTKPKCPKGKKLKKVKGKFKCVKKPRKK